MPAPAASPIGGKQIDLEAFTGTVVESEMTWSTRETSTPARWLATTARYSTSYWNKFRVQSADGKEWSLEVLRTVASVTKGDQVTLFWGLVNGKKATGWRSTTIPPNTSGSSPRRRPSLPGHLCTR